MPGKDVIPGLPVLTNLRTQRGQLEGTIQHETDWFKGQRLADRICGSFEDLDGDVLDICRRQHEDDWEVGQLSV